MGQFSEMRLKIKRIVADKRGKIIVCEADRQEFEIIYSLKNAPRGGHYHSIDSLHRVVHGKYDVWLKDPKSGKERKLLAKEGDRVKVKAGMAHLFLAKKDSIMIETRKGKYDVFIYQPYRKIVEKFLE